MKILMAKGARNIAQSAQSHMRSWLINANTKSDHAVSLKSGHTTPRASDVNTVCFSSLTNANKESVSLRCTSEVADGSFEHQAPEKSSRSSVAVVPDTLCMCDNHGDSQEATRGGPAPESSFIESPGTDVSKSSTTSQIEQTTQSNRSLSTYSKKPSAIVPTYHPKLDSFMLNSGGTSHDLKRFLDVIGTEPKEARYWFKYFKKLTTPTKFFGVIQIEEDIIRQSEAIHRPYSGGNNLDAQSPLNELCSYLAFLQRYDMKCVVVHGQSSTTGHSSEDMQKLQRQTIEDTRLITDLLEKNGAQVRQASIPPVLLGHAGSDTDRNIVDIDPSYLDWVQTSRGIPIVSTVALGPDRQLVNASLFEVTAALSVQLLPLKVLIVNMDGGIMDQDGKVIPKINLPHEEGAACKSPWCTELVKNKIHDISVLLARLQEEQCRLGKTPDSAVIITSGTTLLTELFTHYGSGTFFKITERIHSYENLEHVDTERLTQLIQMAFQRSLRDDYLEIIAEDIQSIFISEGYSAAAIILKEPGVPVPYLDKFVVRKDYQDNSVGCTLWDTVEHAYPQLFWRSRNVNLINPWYFKHSKGSWCDGEWTVFWYGIHQHRLTSELIDHALNKPSSFKDQDPPKKSQGGSGTTSPWSALKYM